MNTLRILFVALVLNLSSLLYPSSVSAQQVNVSLSVFQNDLGRYGSWVNSPRYGQVWIYSEPGFRPYHTNGRWEYTDYGWGWVSDYDWGWGPFHYGRWEEDPYYGWIWIPGYEWAPAWVSWSEYDGNYGWAPLGFGLGINVSFGAIPFNRWTFVPRNQICSPQIRNYYINPSRNRGFQNAVVINNIYVNNNTRFYAGPQRREVERYTRSRVTVRNIDYGRPGRIANNDRGRYDNGPQRIERPGRTVTPGRRMEDRPSNNLPERQSGTGRVNDRFPDRNEGVQRPGSADALPGRDVNPGRPNGRQQQPYAERVETPSYERAERPSYGRRERPSPERAERPSYGRRERPSPERAERPSYEQRERPFPQRMERPGGNPSSPQGDFRTPQRSPEIRQQPAERPSGRIRTEGIERVENGNRGGRRL